MKRAGGAEVNLNYWTNNFMIQKFVVNNLNELSTVSCSGTFTLAGTTSSPATNVNVNGASAFRYTDNTFAKTNLSLFDGNNTFTAVASDNLGRTDTASATYYLPATNTCTYDLNGNLLGDGQRCFAYDGENQLISVWVTNHWRSDFAYDGKMRRRIRLEYIWNGRSWITNTLIHYAPRRSGTLNGPAAHAFYHADANFNITAQTIAT